MSSACTAQHWDTIAFSFLLSPLAWFCTCIFSTALIFKELQHAQCIGTLLLQGMAAEIEDMQALVVSEETSKGADAINNARRERGFAPLALVTVKLVGGRDVASKLSSTALRKAETAQRARTARDQG